MVKLRSHVGRASLGAFLQLWLMAAAAAMPPAPLRQKMFRNSLAGDTGYAGTLKFLQDMVEARQERRTEPVQRPNRSKSLQKTRAVYSAPYWAQVLDITRTVVTSS